jgi:hypothetical protein
VDSEQWTVVSKGRPLVIVHALIVRRRRVIIGIGMKVVVSQITNAGSCGTRLYLK